MVDHEQDVALHAPVGRGTLVVRTVDVQIVINVHCHPVLSMPEPAKQREKSRLAFCFMNKNNHKQTRDAQNQWADLRNSLLR